MKRAEFIELWADIVRAGRKVKHPDIRPSEEAVSRMDDEKVGAKLWEKHRLSFKGMTADEVRDVLKGKP